jgi:hypothetical protein
MQTHLQDSYFLRQAALIPRDKMIEIRELFHKKRGHDAIHLLSKHFFYKEKINPNCPLCLSGYMHMLQEIIEFRENPSLYGY